MKKKLALLLVAAMAVSVLATGCGENENNNGSAVSEGSTEPEVYTTEYMLASTEYDVEDYVKLANYKKIEVEVDKSYEVTDESIKDGANNIVVNYPYYVEVDRAAQEGDIVNIDYFGTKDGTAFNGGTAAQYDLQLGSDSFIDGFEDGLIGHSAGEEVVLNLTFPEEYENNPDLAGQEVQFEVTINAVKEAKDITVDEITDDYVLQNFGTSYGLTNVDDFMATVEESLKNNLNVAIQQAFIDKLVAESEVTLPEGLLDQRVQQTLDAYEAECEAYEMTLEEYLSTYYSQTLDEFKADLTTQTEATLQEELVLEALVAELKCEVVATEFNSFVSYFASSYYMTEEEFIEQCGGKDYLILNYAEYYVALDQASADVKVTFVEAAADTTTEE